MKIKRAIFPGLVYICAQPKRKDKGSAWEEGVTEKLEAGLPVGQKQREINASVPESQRGQYDGQLEVCNEKQGVKR